MLLQLVSDRDAGTVLLDKSAMASWQAKLTHSMKYIVCRQYCMTPTSSPSFWAAVVAFEMSLQIDNNTCLQRTSVFQALQMSSEQPYDVCM